MACRRARSPASEQMLSRATVLLTVALMGSEPFCFMAFMVRITGSGQESPPCRG